MPNERMLNEAREAPFVLLAEAARWTRDAARVRGAGAGRETRVVIGRGSSGNVCVFAQYVIGLQSGRPPVEFLPWLTTQPLPAADWRDAVVHAYSYSGMSTDVAEAAAWLRSRGALVVAITEASDPGAYLLEAADEVVRLGCGPELAVPATKSVTSQLFVAAALAGLPIEVAAAQTAACMQQIEAEGLPGRLAEFLRGARTVTWLARGPSRAGALDAALKVQEAVGLPSAGYSTAEYLHGPIAAAHPEDRVVVFSGADEPMESKQAVVAALLARGVPFVALGTDQTFDAHLPIKLPHERWARTAVLMHLAQLTCATLAAKLGVDPDEPRSLRKITRTR